LSIAVFAVAASSTAAMPAVAAPAPAAPVASISTLAGMAGSLLLVIGLILLCAWLLKRLGGLQAGGGDLLRVRASLGVGLKERVVLVEAAGETLLLGVSPGGVTCLHRFDGPLPESAARPAGFAQLLQKQLGGGTRP
jgi:flagellar protein FliO/FliZ